MDKLSGMRGPGAWGSIDQSQPHQDYGSNPPAPHGRPFGLVDAINAIRDIRSPPNGSLLGNSVVNVPDGRGLDRFASRREELGNIGPLTPLAKLLKKV